MGNILGTTEVYGVDIFEESIQRWGAKGIKAYQANLSDPLPLNSESSDVICASQVLEHLNHTDLFIKELYRFLRPGATP